MSSARMKITFGGRGGEDGLSFVVAAAAAAAEVSIVQTTKMDSHLDTDILQHLTIQSTTAEETTYCLPYHYTIT